MTDDERDELEYAKADASADETRPCPVCHGSGYNCPECVDDEPEDHDDDDQ